MITIQSFLLDFTNEIRIFLYDNIKMGEVAILLTVAILLFIVGFVIAICISYNKVKKLEKECHFLASKLKDIIVEFDFALCFKELVGIINTEVKLNSVISNISKIIHTALNLHTNEHVIFYSIADDTKSSQFLYAYPDITMPQIDGIFFNGITSKTKLLKDENIFLLFPIYIESKLTNFLVLRLNSAIDNLDFRLSNLEAKVEELIRFISLGFKAPTFYERATKDSLTDLYNKKHFEIDLETFTTLSHRENIPLCLIVLDIDNFKSINDNFGHQIGDKVILEVAKIIKGSIRSYNMPYRIGGEEFAIILPNCKEDRAVQIAERVRKRVEELSIYLDNNKKLNITVSLGVNELQIVDNSTNFFKKTDMALYSAKRTGKNKLVSARSTTIGKM